jgi:hypothetical protein
MLEGMISKVNEVGINLWKENFFEKVKNGIEFSENFPSMQSIGKISWEVS